MRRPTTKVVKVYKSNGKNTERELQDRLYQLYGTNIILDRFLDKSDTKRYQDVRPSDFFASFAKTESLRVAYIECKDTMAAKMSLGFSRFRVGQIQAMHRCHRLEIPYFVVFKSLQTNKSYLIPGSEIVKRIDAGKKSMTEAEVFTFLWNIGEKLYDYTCPF